MVLSYTDAFSEALVRDGRMLGVEGLLPSDKSGKAGQQPLHDGVIPCVFRYTPRSGSLADG
jgi:hypothetical protein